MRWWRGWKTELGAGVEAFQKKYVRHNRSTKTLLRQQPLPSMLIRMLRALRKPVNSALENWLPWSKTDADLRAIGG